MITKEQRAALEMLAWKVERETPGEALAIRAALATIDAQAAALATARELSARALATMASNGVDGAVRDCLEGIRGIRRLAALPAPPEAAATWFPGVDESGAPMSPGDAVPEAAATCGKGRATICVREVGHPGLCYERVPEGAAAERARIVAEIRTYARGYAGLNMGEIVDALAEVADRIEAQAGKGGRDGL